MKKIMKKIGCIIFEGIFLCLVMCGCSYKVDNEKAAQCVYTCSSNNMAGLEKIVIFDDYFVVIFDAPKHDKSDWAILDFYVDAKRQTVYAVYEGTYAKSDTGVLEKKNGKYIASADLVYGRVYDDTVEHELTAVVVQGYRIELNNGNLILEDSLSGGESVTYLTQNYNLKTGKWSDVEKNTVLYGMTGE